MSDKRYISYFQSVITIGLLNVASSPENAAEKAKKRLTDENGVNHCFFDQTQFDLSETEEWVPDIESEHDEGGFKFAFNPTPEIKNVLSTRLHKDINDLTDDDYTNFFKESIQSSLKA